MTIEEQNQILDYINQSTQDIRQVIADTENQIQNVNEYRTALIAEAVTGKIDVRDAVHE